eukprot:14412397-Heterocapsa_arctica.AAC.1
MCIILANIWLPAETFCPLGRFCLQVYAAIYADLRDDLRVQNANTFVNAGLRGRSTRERLP